MTSELKIQIHSELNRMDYTYKTEIMRMEFQLNAIRCKTKELNALINEDNFNKLREVNAVDINDGVQIQRILAESPDIKLFNEYLDELKRDADTIKSEMNRKQSFYERIKRHIYYSCDHLWILDHFENPATMGMVGCTYCNVCGMVRDGDV